MRYLKKPNFTPDCLHSEDASPPKCSSEAARRWKAYDAKLLTSLLTDDQLSLCGYSEICFESRAVGFHLEHIKPKGKFPQLTFSYENIILCALSNSDLPIFRESVFGGHYKQSHFDRKFFLSPLKSCSKKGFFLYLSDGRVVPSPKKSKRYQKKAKHTINALNLNASCLVNWRKTWIEELDFIIDENLEKDMSIYHLACICLLPYAGRLSEFFSATKQRFGKIGDIVLAGDDEENNW